MVTCHIVASLVWVYRWKGMCLIHNSDIEFSVTKKLSSRTHSRPFCIIFMFLSKKNHPFPHWYDVFKSADNLEFYNNIDIDNQSLRCYL